MYCKNLVQYCKNEIYNHISCDNCLSVEKLCKKEYNHSNKKFRDWILNIVDIYPYHDKIENQTFFPEMAISYFHEKDLNKFIELCEYLIYTDYNKKDEYIIGNMLIQNVKCLDFESNEWKFREPKKRIYNSRENFIDLEEQEDDFDWLKMFTDKYSKNKRGCKCKKDFFQPKDYRFENPEDFIEASLSSIHDGNFLFCEILDFLSKEHREDIMKEIFREIVKHKECINFDIYLYSYKYDFFDEFNFDENPNPIGFKKWLEIIEEYINKLEKENFSQTLLKNIRICKCPQICKNISKRSEYQYIDKRYRDFLTKDGEDILSNDDDKLIYMNMEEIYISLVLSYFHECDFINFFECMYFVQVGVNRINNFKILSKTLKEHLNCIDKEEMNKWIIYKNEIIFPEYMDEENYIYTEEDYFNYIGWIPLNNDIRKKDMKKCYEEKLEVIDWIEKFIEAFSK